MTEKKEKYKPVPPPAPKGNKYALGNNGGTPRTVSYSEEEMISLGQEMVAWIKVRQDEILHLSQWYTIEKMYTYNQWKTFIQRPEFIPFYEVALRLIGLKYLDRDSSIRDNVAPKWQRLYFRDMFEDEESMKDADSLRKKEEEAVSKESLSKLLHGPSDSVSQK
jgi:hypothetical protein